MSGYSFNPYALPNIVVGLGLLLWGALLRMRESRSETGIWALGASLSAATWLLGIAAAYSSTTALLASRWINVSQVGVILLVPTLYELIRHLLGLTGWRRLLSPGLWGVATIFLFLLFFTSDYQALPHHYFWGYYVRYRTAGLALSGYFGCVLVFLLTECWRVWRQAPPESARRRRAFTLLVGFGVGFLAAVDFLPAYGVAIYPFGYIMVAFTVVTVGNAAWRYRTASVTAYAAAEQILKTLPDGVLILDEIGLIARVNARGSELIGRSAEDLLGHSLDEVLPAMAALAARVGSERSKKPVSGEIELEKNPGSAKTFIDVTVDALYDVPGAPSLTVLVLQDVTHYRVAIDRIQELIHFDQTTGLPNRRHLQNRINRAIKDCAFQRQVAVSVVRVEHVQHVLDSAPDRMPPDPVLMAVSERLRDFAEAANDQGLSATVGYLHGYEFAMFFEGMESIGQITLTVAELLARLRQPVERGTHRVKPVVWLGVSLYPGDGRTANRLLECAMAATDQAASAGDERAHFYNASSNAVAVDSLMLSTRLEHAIEKGELDLHFQPIVNANSHAIEFVEALVRWDDPRHGLRSPAEFIHVAEQSGLVIALDRWVLIRACETAARWRQIKGQSAPAVTVNLSGVHLSTTAGTDLVGTVEEALKATGLAPDRLVLEITESRMVIAKKEVVGALSRLREQGVHISMDDFGTGYASLSYLQWLPLDELKIDRSFVAAIGHDARKTALLEAMLLLARKLDLHVIAEGVDDPRQVAFLAQHGCDYLQGYLFCRPVSGEKFSEILQGRSVPWSLQNLENGCDARAV